MDIFIHNINIFNVESEDDEDGLEYLRRPYTLRGRVNHFNYWDDVEFFARFRLKKQTFMLLFNKIEHQLLISWNKTRALTPVNQLLLALRFFATGSFLRVNGDFFNVSASTASRIVKKVSMIIASLCQEVIKMPGNIDEIKVIQQGFYSMHRFPRVVGCIDCTHIRIQSPGGDSSENFRNRKGYFSLNVQVICDHNMKAINIVARWPGSAHDSTIFGHSNIKKKFDENEFGNGLLLGDSGYPLKDYLLTPLLNPITPGEIRYNGIHIRTRNIIERYFGVWKRRFPVLSVGMRLKIETIQDIIVATAVLNNIARDQMEEEPPMVEDINFEGSQDEPQNVTHPTIAGRDIVRRRLIEDYFSRM